MTEEYDDTTKEWFIPDNYKDWAFNSFKEGKDPAVECGIIMWMLTFRRPNTDKERRVWCDVPVQHLADTLRVRRSRITDALANLVELGIIKPDQFNDTAAMRHRPLVYRMMNKVHRWPTTPSSNPVVAKSIEQKVEAKKSSPPPPKTPLHTPITTQPNPTQETPEERWARMTPAERAEWHRINAESNKEIGERILKQIADERKERERRENDS